MAACTLSDLLDDACSNAFQAVAQNTVQVRSLVLQLLYDYAGSTETLSELYDQACSNGFTKVAENTVQRRSLVLQLLCDTAGD